MSPGSKRTGRRLGAAAVAVALAVLAGCATTPPGPTPAQVRSSQAPGAAPAAPANEPGSGSILGVLGI